MTNPDVASLIRATLADRNRRKNASIALANQLALRCPWRWRRRAAAGVANGRRSVDSVEKQSNRRVERHFLLEDVSMPRGTIQSVFDDHEAAVDEIIASCSGDMRGAVEALMLVNEQLESELQQLWAAIGPCSPRECWSKISIH